MKNQFEAINIFLKPIQFLLNDEAVSEIMINKPFDVWFKKFGSKSEKVDIEFDDLQLRGLITLLAAYSKKIITNERSQINSFQIISAYIPGFRFEAWNTPVSPWGPSLTIRRISSHPIPLLDYVKKEAITTELYPLIKNLISTKRNIVIAGSTGSGKTTFCSSLLNCIDQRERLIVIENVQEIRIDLPNVLYLAADEEQGYGVDRLITSALRGLPDRIIIGELRGNEASGFLKAANTGHPGSITTLHANSGKDAIYRLEEMVKSSEISLQMQSIKQRISRIEPIFIFIKLVSRKNFFSPKVTEILEVKNNKSYFYSINEIYKCI